MTSKMLVAMALVSGFVAYCFRRARGAQVEAPDLKDDLKRWEGEGGNAPAIAAPSPSPRPHPEPGSALRH